ncbi:MAG: hypothetical protein A2W98_03895 [Bacteroidetes bacterium GWF2_33_38]|nr:MAG: hypothetical protein A2W98_03895 [Bacteroidetes bacterium GWF2_33_38]OFY76198.1 MAG: hypothetical protein A2265_10720 [Bacteroidetes bacterium RIFOXYA12_FULL_33_9]OFY92103.1 MAG: hypothetical protein A2236_07590 [Bacteroidetes bacterium RIFOXYA2_FULL_33_7]
MEKEIFNAKIPFRKENSLLNESMLFYDLPNIIEKMKTENNCDDGELNSMILMKNREMKMILAELHENTIIKSFQSNSSTTFQILEGKLKFQARKKTLTLDKGQMLSLNEKIKYRLTISAETVLLLTIANF